MHKYNPLNKVYELIRDNNFMIFQIWYKEILFSWRWWLEVILSIVPWIIWIKYRDKKRSARLLFVGMIVAITVNSLDIIGGNFNLWHYDWKVFPFAPMYIPWDFTLFPILIMFLLQVKPNVKPLYKGLVFTTYSSFISEPVFHWLGLYDPVRWKYWYSFGIYLLLYMFYNYVYNSKLLKGIDNA